jgi:hypothetical protein
MILGYARSGNQMVSLLIAYSRVKEKASQHNQREALSWKSNKWQQSDHFAYLTMALIPRPMNT